MTHVQLDDLRKEFADVVAVDDVSLDIPDESFTVLVGPSGCGKTTTLRLIAGLERATDGEIQFGDDVVNEKRAFERDISMVFQNYALYPHMTVEENMRFGLEQHDVPEDEIERRVDEAAELLQIGDLLDRQPSELSGGQQQRTALGRAIVREPGVFLMDEPLSNLDAKLRVQMRAELNKLHDELKTTTVYVTHDQVEAMTLADQIAVMNDGQIMQVGHPTFVYHHPRNMFVADFLGSPSMNFVQGTLERRGDDLVVDGPIDHVVPDAYHDDLESHVGQAVNLGIRPENVHQSGTGYEAEVTVVEPLGEKTVLNVTFDGSQEYYASVEPDTDIESGDTITLEFERDTLHYFDPTSGESLNFSEDATVKEGASVPLE